MKIAVILLTILALIGLTAGIVLIFLALHMKWRYTKKRKNKQMQCNSFFTEF